MITTNNLTVEFDVHLDDEMKVLIDDIISLYAKAGCEVSAQRVVNMAFTWLNADCSSLKRTL